MVIGILSDTHGRVAIARAAVDELSAAGCEYFIHCGDVGSTQVLDCLAGLPSVFVFGNTDYDAEELRRYGESIGISCLGDGGELELDGKKLAVTHGHEPEVFRRLMAAEPDYLFTGH
ncbi:MAG TPA: metallophosphoesterase family protein, partial [Tepidisphaeraceae bacterium]|nr:metallophosphoesterase family protein [Tepidisphaeraceae bacterium]